MRLPRDPEELLPTLGAFGVAIGLSKLLSSKQALTFRSVFGRAVEGGAFAVCGGGLGLLLPYAVPGLKEVPPLVLLGLGGLLASLGMSGLIGLVRAVRGAPSK